VERNRNPWSIGRIAKFGWAGGRGAQRGWAEPGGSKIGGKRKKEGRGSHPLHNHGVENGGQKMEGSTQKNEDGVVNQMKKKGTQRTH